MNPRRTPTAILPRRGRRWVLPAVVFLSGAALSLGLCIFLRGRERAARTHDFEREAAQLAAQAEDSFDTPLEVLRSIPAFFAACETVARAEFRAFVTPALERYPWIYALEWIPRVPGNERAAYESAAVADGITDYRFKQDAPSGPPVTADPRPEYFPIFFMEPLNPVAVGLEETALPARKAALERARDTGATAVSERLQLVQDPTDVASVIAFHPVYHRGMDTDGVEARGKALKGLAAAVFRVAPVLAAALKGDRLSRFDLAVIDLDALPPRPLYESHPGTMAGRDRASWEHVGTIAGRRWAFRVGDRAGAVSAGFAGVPLLGIGLVISLLCSALCAALQSAVRLRRQVQATRRLGQYTLAEKLGQGGMGTVYRARHATLQRPTAIKLLDPRRTDPAALARFESEVRLTSALSHPNTIVVYDYGHSPDGLFYYCMEYIDGITLQSLVDVTGPQPPERVVHILGQVCAALVEAHGIGLVHRDIKPSNIMLCNRGGIPDFVKLLDFGLVKELARRETGLSLSDVLLGTPLFLAPELIADRNSLDARADLYAVGAVAYYLLTGTHVFTGATIMEICAHHLHAPPETPSERVGRAVPADLEALVLRCLAKQPGGRPDSAEALGDALRALALPPWDPPRAKAWWAEHGAAIEAHLALKRAARDEKQQDLTLNVALR